MTRRVLRGILPPGLAVLWVLLAAGPALAHPTLVTTAPPAGYAVTEAPSVVSIAFDEPVLVRQLVVRGQGRGPVRTSRVEMSGGGRTASVRPAQPLPPGRYTVQWQITAQDGDVVDGSFGFGVATSAPAAGVSATQTAGTATAALLRWAVFLGLALALGGVAGDRLVRQRVLRAGRPLATPPPLIRAGGLVGAAAGIGLALHQMGGGNPLAGLTGGSPASLWVAPAGRLVVVETVAFAVVALAGRARGRSGVAGVLALTVVVLAEAERSHLRVAGQGWGSLTIAVHLAAAAVWLGALVHVLRAAFRWRDTPGQARGLLASYGLLALVLYLTVVATGTVAAVLVLPTWSALWRTAYGAVLLGKLALVLAISALALAARRGLRNPAPVRADTPVGRLVRGERAGLVAVLAVTALLTALPPPPDPTKGLAYPPPVAEPAVRLGTLAGQVTTGLVASADHLEVRLGVPETDPNARPRYQLTGSVAGAGGAPRPLALTGCGDGCFVAPVSWDRPGPVQVELTVAADGWRGGSARFTVPWPPRPRPDLLARVLSVMRQQPALTLTETSTSDTTGPTPPAETLQMTGADLVEREPYRSGVVSSVVELRRDAGATEVAFAVTGEGIFVRLVVDDAGRLVREEITSPNHLIMHIFVYPADG